ncbi:MAG: SPOR domain-containing protein, partial [Caldimonas sp.]
MGLFSIFKRTGASTDAGAGAVDTVDAVQQARMRARRRLVGAVVLLVIGVIGFPLVFETRPRPIPIDIPIEIPKRESAPPLVMPPAHQAPTSSASKPAAAVARGNAEMTTEARSDAPRESARPAPSAPSAASGDRAVVRTASPASAPIVEARKPAPTAHAPPEAARAVTSAQASAPMGKDGAKAKALLEAKPAAAAADGRYVVQ